MEKVYIKYAENWEWKDIPQFISSLCAVGEYLEFIALLEKYGLLSTQIAGKYIEDTQSYINEAVDKCITIFNPSGWDETLKEFAYYISNGMFKDAANEIFILLQVLNKEISEAFKSEVKPFYNGLSGISDYVDYMLDTNQWKWEDIISFIISLRTFTLLIEIIGYIEMCYSELEEVAGKRAVNELKNIYLKRIWDEKDTLENMEVMFNEYGWREITNDLIEALNNSDFFFALEETEKIYKEIEERLTNALDNYQKWGDRVI